MCAGWIEEALAESGYEGVVQLATFHPAYQFDGEEGVTVYTNRSPYPTFHLINEVDMSHVLDHYPEPELIPEKNIHRLESLGLKVIQQTLSQCGWSDPK